MMFACYDKESVRGLLPISTTLVPAGGKIVVVGPAYLFAKRAVAAVAKEYGCPLVNNVDSCRTTVCGRTIIAVQTGDGSKARGVRADAYVLVNAFAIPREVIEMLYHGEQSVRL